MLHKARFTEIQTLWIGVRREVNVSKYSQTLTLISSSRPLPGTMIALQYIV